MDNIFVRHTLYKRAKGEHYIIRNDDYVKLKQMAAREEYHVPPILYAF